MTQDTHALPPSRIVWWCAVCGSYTLEQDGTCPNVCDLDGSFGSETRYARQRRRRVYICVACDGEEDMYLTKAAFLEHMAEMADA